MSNDCEVIWDLESNGLLDEVTKIWCLSYRYVEDPTEVITLTNYDNITKFIVEGPREGSVLIGHNIIGYDLKVVKKLLGVEISCKIIDTLPLSWYLNHERVIHGLDSYGEEFGVPKPKIDDWENQTLDDYIHRCEEDTLINLHLWLQLKQKLQELYNA